MNILSYSKVFPPDFDFMIEGIVAAEPAAYLIRCGIVEHVWCSGRGLWGPGFRVQGLGLELTRRKA